MKDAIQFLADILKSWMIDMYSYICQCWQSASLDERIVVGILTVYLVFCGLLCVLKVAVINIHTRQMKKGILLLKKEISDIEVKCSEGIDFSFVTDNLQGTPIEQRNTFDLVSETKGDESLPSAELKKRLKKLKAYYEGIKKEIVDNKIPDNVLSVSEIDYLIDYVMTEENICRAITELNNKRKRNDAELAFIGNKMGLYEYSYDKNKMNWLCFQSDHFTWKIFKELYLLDKPVGKEGKEIAPHQFFNDLCLRLSKHQKKEKYRKVLMHTLCYLFSSLGIDLLVTGKDCKNRKVCLVSLRSASVDSSHTSRIHVSVDESFSDTDQLQDGVYTVSKWVNRGIEEEIGIPENDFQQETKRKITYTDFSIVLGYGEIGLSGIVEEMNMDSLLMYPGMDKALESDGMFLIRMPGFCGMMKMLRHLRTGVQRYVDSHTSHAMGKFPWVEFAPPIYFRTMLRKLAVPFGVKDAFFWASLVASLVLLINKAEIWSGKWIWNWNLVYYLGCMSFCWFDYLSRKYTKFSLWVPLWHGNVKTLQLTGRLVKPSGLRDVNKGLYLVTEKKASQVVLAMDQLQIRETPLCAVRRALEREEVPISFYHACSSGESVLKKKNLRLFSTYYDGNANEICYYVIYTQNKREEEAKKDPHVMAYSFNFGMKKNMKLRFDKKIDQLDITPKALQCYFGLHNLKMDDYVYCNKLPNRFDRTYRLHDLFEYKGDYYWSACHKDTLSKANIPSLLSMLYDQHKVKDNDDGKLTWTAYSKSITKTKDELVGAYRSVTNQGKIVFIEVFKMKADKKIQLEKKLNALIRRSVERLGGKLNELEIIALQYIMVRESVFVADIRYGWSFDLKWKDKLKDLLDALKPS